MVTQKKGIQSTKIVHFIAHRDCEALGVLYLNILIQRNLNVMAHGFFSENDVVHSCMGCVLYGRNKRAKHCLSRRRQRFIRGGCAILWAIFQTHRSVLACHKVRRVFLVAYAQSK